MSRIVAQLSEFLSLDNRVGNLLASFVVIALLGLVFYSIISISDDSRFTAVLSFSLTILGVILGFYFNKGQVSSVVSERNDAETRLADLEAHAERLETRYEDLVKLVERTLEEL